MCNSLQLVDAFTEYLIPSKLHPTGSIFHQGMPRNRDQSVKRNNKFGLLLNSSRKRVIPQVRKGVGED